MLRIAFGARALYVHPAREIIVEVLMRKRTVAARCGGGIVLGRRSCAEWALGNPKRG